MMEERERSDGRKRGVMEERERNDGRKREE